MVRKTPFQDVLKILKEKGYTALITEKDYKGVIHPFPGLCSKNHECNISVPELKKGKGCCRKCGYESRNIKLKELYEISFEKLLEKAKLYGYKVLIEEKDYKGKESKVPCLCSKSHNCDASVKKLIKGENCCKKCGPVCIKKTFTFEEMLKIAEIRGYKILIERKDYDKDNKIPCLCPKSHNCNVIPERLERGKIVV